MDVKGELHLRMDSTLDDEVTSLFENQGRLSARLLIAGIEGKAIGFDEGVMHGTLVTVDEGDRIAPVQIEVAGIIVPPLLQHDADDIGEVGSCGSQRETSRCEHEGPGEERSISEIALRHQYNLEQVLTVALFLALSIYRLVNSEINKRINLDLAGDSAPICALLATTAEQNLYHVGRALRLCGRAAGLPTH